MSSEEGVAISLLKRAVELDSKKRYTESLVCYKEGLHHLMQFIKVTKDESRQVAYRAKARDYLDRAERLDKIIEEQKKSGQFHEQIRIEKDSTGHSYHSLFGRFLDHDVVSIVVEDPYIRSHHQIMNFLRLCELLVKSCVSLEEISLLTGPDNSPQGRAEQARKLEELQQDLKARKVSLKVSYSDTLHDREIRLNNGWIVKIGRGLDIYQAAKGRTVVGLFDMDLRPCHATIVDIFHRINLVKS